MMSELEGRLRAQVASAGPLPFEQFVEQCLYDADFGFYATHGQAGGRRGDFVTSVEIGPLFAAVVGDWLDTAWREAGQPQEFRVAEVGAGVGTLFRGLNRSVPECFDALTYTLVERSAAMQVAHQSLPSDRWRSATELPAERQHVVLANELLDNLAFGVAERVDDGWAPVHVAVRDGELVLQVAAVDRRLDHLNTLAPTASPGSRVPVASAAAEWLASAKSSAERLLVFDYGATTAELASRGQSGWLRTYVGHSRGSDPFVGMGGRDITYDVPIDQLPPGYEINNQADWLQANGLPERLAEARAVWRERAHIGDLAAVAARSAIGEAEALTDATGLGAFWVIEWR